MSERPEQRCSKCDAPTGRTDDDTIYDEETELPLCEECLDESESYDA